MTELCNPLAYPVMLHTPDWRPPGTPADGRLPLAMWVVALLEPAQVVALGVGRGTTYSALCQAVQELHLATQCVGIELDGSGSAAAEQTGASLEFRAHHRLRYGGFSRLIRGEALAAAADFSDGSIDLLHLSAGLNEAEAAAAWRQWRPKLSACAAVLVSHINPADDGPSLTHFWAEVKLTCPHFELRQGPGLGLLLPGAEPPACLAQLTGLPAPTGVALRELLYRLGLAAAHTGEAAEEQPPHSAALEAPLLPAEAALRARDLEIAGLNQTLREQTEHLDQLQNRLELVMAREREMRTLYQDLQNQLLYREQLAGQTADRDRVIAQLQGEIVRLNTASNETIAQLKAEKDGLCAAGDEALTELRADLALAQAEIRTIHAGRIWRLMVFYWQTRYRVLSLFRGAPADGQ